MLKILRSGELGHLETVCTAPDWRLPEDAVWIDLISPTRDEELAVERALDLQVPTREDMVEIESSSRLYQEGGATFMTAVVLYASESDQPRVGPITFVLTKGRLVTVRYMEPRSFKFFVDQAERQPHLCPDGATTFLNLIEAVVDRTADILEAVALEVDEVSSTVFRQGASNAGKFKALLARLGQAQAKNAKARESLVSLSRLVSFAHLDDTIETVADHREHLKSLHRDVTSLTDQASYLSSNVTFTLDTALGLINVEQNAIIKIFSVAAVAFLPPTLVASIYGMNFSHMPELDWRLGYPMAVGVMVLSAVLPLLWFKRKGWL